MKKIFLLIALLGSFTFCNAQKLHDFSTITINSDDDFDATANDAALQAASYILSVPPIQEDETLKDASAYLLKWMSGSPDYTFGIDMALLKLVEDNKELTIVMMAAMAEYQLQNKANKDDEDKVRLETAKTMIKYALYSGNNVTPQGELKKAIKANKKGKLNEFLLKLNQ